MKRYFFIDKENTGKRFLKGLKELSKKDLSVLKIGKPREMVYNAQVNNYKFGVVAGSGLNTIAAIREKGIDIDIKAMETSMPLNEMDRF